MPGIILLDPSSFRSRVIVMIGVDLEPSRKRHFHGVWITLQIRSGIFEPRQGKTIRIGERGLVEVTTVFDLQIGNAVFEMSKFSIRASGDAYMHRHHLRTECDGFTLLPCTRYRICCEGNGLHWSIAVR